MSRDRLGETKALISYLCSPECGGRRAGSPEGRRARHRIIAELERSGARPSGEDGSFEQRLPLPHAANVLAKVRGAGPKRDEYILVAAHYDHLGWANRGEAYWGADDNAAAVAALVDLAHTLVERQAELNRSVMLAAFDAEEPPFFLCDAMGSMHFVHRPTIPVSSIAEMVCLDLVGHALGGPELPPSFRASIFVLGAELSTGTGRLIDGLTLPGLRPLRVDNAAIPPLSDYHAFAEAGVPHIFLSAGRWAHYHRVTDTPDRLDLPKILSVATWLTELVITLSGRAARPQLQRNGLDPEATLRTVTTLFEEAAPYLPRIEAGRPLISRLSRKLETNGRFRQADVATLHSLLLQLEAELAG